MDRWIGGRQGGPWVWNKKPIASRIVGGLRVDRAQYGVNVERKFEPWA